MTNKFVHTINHLLFSEMLFSESLRTGLVCAGKIIKNTIESGTSVWWVGNGGSAAICSHLAQDMLNRLNARSIFLDNSSLMTCMANDFGYENIFLHPLKTLVKPGDLLIAVSSSGNSENIVSCAEMALKNQVKLISMSGMDEDNRLWNMRCDLSFLYHPVYTVLLKLPTRPFFTA